MRCLGRIRGEMVSVMTTHLPSTLVAHAGGKLCEHLTATQARYLASISSCGLRPNPPLTPQGLSHHVGSPEPRLAHFLGRLAAFSRLIVFDKRGTGMSDPVDSVRSSRRSAGRPGGRSDCETAKQGLATRRSVADSVVRHCLSSCGDLAPGPLLRAGECDVQSETAGDRCR